MKVAIIDLGQGGLFSSRAAGDYQGLNELLQDHLTADRHEVGVFQDMKTARGWLAGEGAMVFTTRGMIGHAVEHKAKHPEIRIAVLVGSPIDFHVPFPVVEKSEIVRAPEKVLQAIVGG